LQRGQIKGSASSTFYAKAKDRKRAFDALKRASERGFRDAAALERNDFFDFLRADPSMKKILEEIGEKRHCRKMKRADLR